MELADMIDLESFPLNQPETEKLKQIVARARADLRRDGCAVLKGFLRPSGIGALVREADAAAPNAHASHSRTNAYFTKDDPDLPPDHPVRRFFDRSNAFIAADNFPDGSALRAIYDFDGFEKFIATCLEEPSFYRYADPLADVIVNMADAGNGFPWHFDTNNFTVTLAIQMAKGGGAFEYAPNIRAESENFEEVQRVLDGTSKKVTRLDLEPGDLQIFRGRNSLHRVAPLNGPTPRYVAIFSYSEQPDMVATPERCLQLYGKVLPVHYAHAQRRMDTYLD